MAVDNRAQSVFIFNNYLRNSLLECRCWRVTPHPLKVTATSQTMEFSFERICGGLTRFNLLLSPKNVFSGCCAELPKTLNFASYPCEIIVLRLSRVTRHLEG